ncbi:exlusion protein FxsA [Vibrio cholerae]|nr:exlusion protein FxsA [Vibrio cholerae]EGR0080257.1 exlusion protein FxsA [Vibrio cholerae]
MLKIIGKQWATKLTNASKGLPTRGVSSPNEPQWFRLLCLSLVVMRCQPLRRALYLRRIL